MGAPARQTNLLINHRSFISQYNLRPGITIFLQPRQPHDSPLSPGSQYIFATSKSVYIFLALPKSVLETLASSKHKPRVIAMVDWLEEHFYIHKS
jgi:hypothetical protein